MSTWMVDTVMVCGQEMYEVFRFRDESKAACPENREGIGGIWMDRQGAEKMAAFLNGQGKGRKGGELDGWIRENGVRGSI